MKKHLLFLFPIILAFISCDKIQEQDYLIFAGASGEWFDGQGVQDHSQRVVIEKYTGVRCVNCPTADQTIHNTQSLYGDKLLAIAIHDSSFSFGRPIAPSPDLRTPDGNAWSNFFGVATTGEYPKAIINRSINGTSWDLFDPKNSFNDRVDAVLSQPTQVAVALQAAKQGDAVQIQVDLQFLQTVNPDITVTLILIEDSIIATQRQPDGSDDPNYIHNHVLRDVITDLWGADIVCEGESGEKRMAKFQYSQYQPEWNLNNCHILAYISDKASKQILNAAQCPIKNVQ